MSPSTPPPFDTHLASSHVRSVSPDSEAGSPVTQLLDRVADRAETIDVRLGLLAGATAIGSYLVFVTELMSAFGRLSAAYIAAAWVVPVVVTVWLASRPVRRV